MASAKVVVNNKSGLHLRPATIFSQICGKMSSNITIIAGEKKVNPKSVLMLMCAGIVKGTEIEIITEGANEEEDLKALVEAINGGLGEEE